MSPSTPSPGPVLGPILGPDVHPTPSGPGLLRAERRRRALSPDALAEQVGVHPMTVLRWERGERLPGPLHQRELARVLGLEAAQVVACFDAIRPPARRSSGLRALGLRQLRNRVRLPAARVAETVGVPPATVYNWETGRARLPPEHLPALAAAFQVEVAALPTLLRATPATEVRPTASPLRRLRHRCGLSQACVATRIGVSRHLLGRWERGERPPLIAVRRLASVYGAPVATVAHAAGVPAPELLDPRRWSPGDLPAVLRILRQWCGLTQRELAERCGCSVAAVRGWERGRGAPHPRRVHRLEAVFGLPAGALVSALPSSTTARRG